MLIDSPVLCEVCGDLVKGPADGKLEVVDTQLDQGRVYEIRYHGKIVHPPDGPHVIEY